MEDFFDILKSVLFGDIEARGRLRARGVPRSTWRHFNRTRSARRTDFGCRFPEVRFRSFVEYMLRKKRPEMDQDVMDSMLWGEGFVDCGEPITTQVVPK